MQTPHEMATAIRAQRVAVQVQRAQRRIARQRLAHHQAHLQRRAAPRPISKASGNARAHTHRSHCPPHAQCARATPSEDDESD